MTALPAGSAGSAGAEMRRWSRFSPLQRWGRAGTYVLVATALVWSVRTIEVIPEFLADAPEQTADLFARMWPIDWSYWGRAARAGLIETLHTATLGTLIALSLAVPVALLASVQVTRSSALNALARLVLVSSRSVNSLIWALLFVAVFGPGALAGTLAIAFRSVGFIGKLLAEALDEANAGPVEALVAAGAPMRAVLLKAYWPQVQPSFWSVALFRWDINVRESAVLGLVGGGGIGVALEAAMSNLYWDQVGLCLLVIFAVVIATEVVTGLLRSRVI